MEIVASPEIAFLLKNELGSFTVHAIRQQLSDAIFNIIDNGTKAITGKGQVLIMILKDSEYPTKNIKIKISDTGNGIAKDKQSKIFELGITYNSGGTGYGLWRSRNIIEGFGGTLYLENSSNEGTTFCVTLPISSQHTSISEKKNEY